MKVTVCTDSCCRLKGCHRVLHRLEELIAENGLQGSAVLAIKMCSGNCGDGVSVELDGVTYSVKESDVDVFFKSNILQVANLKQI